MAKGQEAKDLVIEKIKEAFGSDFVGVYDKKVYLWSSEGGARTQVCLTLTCPKVPIGDLDAITDGDTLDFTGQVAQTKVQTTEISASERENIENLMARLGL